MKLNWFSPLPPARTDIANYTQRILSALKEQGAGVTLWTDQSDVDLEIRGQCEIRCYRAEQMPWPELNQEGLAIYNLGNNPLFHENIWQISLRHPGIVILHDYRLHDFFSEIYRVNREDCEGYLKKLAFYYGQTGRQAGEAFLKGELTIDDMNEQYPLTILALENALGIISHNKKNIIELQRDNRWPVSYLPLPFRPHDDHPIRRAQTPPFRLVVFGYLGKNRRLDQTIDALATFERRDSFHLDIYGELWDPYHFLEKSRLLGVEHLITIHGFVPVEHLDNALSNANLALNLRYPDMGEASGSQLRIWNHSLPSLVTRVGWYADIPNNVVGFVRPGHEIEDIQAHLAAFIENPVCYSEMGIRGRKILEKHHHPTSYAKALIQIAAQKDAFRPYASAHYLVTKVASEVGLYSDQSKSGELLKNAAQQIHDMNFNAHPKA